MRRALVLTIAALAGLLLVWLIVVRAPQLQPAAAPAKPVAPAPAPVENVAPPPEAVASKPDAVAPADVVAEKKPPPEPPKPVVPPPAPDVQSDDADANVDQPADDSGSDDSSADDSDSSSDAPPEIDTDHATDLLADMIAREENASEGDHLPNATLQTLKQFDKESADASWSENAEQHIEASLDEWIGALPADAQAHLALIHVECRATLCQVLAADNDPQSQGERSAAGHEWQQAMGSLPQQPWWHELGFVDLNTQVSSADDHTLYMSYLLRETKAPPVPDAAPDTGDTGGGGG
ncbi:MAG TPA: hypothetical protein VFV97_10895 [Rhodanobacteraceae bacterium]|nr:hypothetical protein [Rhodanobacteraceae bacterium]